MTDNNTPQKPPMTDKIKYTLLTIAAVLLSGAYFIGKSIQINPTYDNKAIASTPVNPEDMPKADIIKPENLKLFPSDEIMGDVSENPKVRIIEYASLTCPHCAMFHQDSLGVIKNDYITAKKAQYIFRDYPLDGAALKASLLAKCDLSKRQAFIDLLFKKQSEWTKAKTIEDVEKNLIMFGKIGGLSEEQITKCFNDKDLSDEILSVQKDSNTLFNIQATPTIIINNQMFTGGLKVHHLKQILDNALKVEDKAEDKKEETTKEETTKEETTKEEPKVKEKE
jgi:protein-disulfide isomerase